ncbi:hypothetical protein AB0H76_32070 [Nocardia sp. NPDC050712]|uniref:hypothetical protein n=1 Tax=Nocardia sp. NPDC050712 TaxID=3155518 RepID=UPI0033E8019A
MRAPEHRPLMTGDRRVAGRRFRAAETRGAGDGFIGRTATAEPFLAAEVFGSGGGRRFGLVLAHLYVLAMCAILALAFWTQFGRWEYPGPMGLLQRMFFLLSAIGPGYLIARARDGEISARDWACGWGWAVSTAGCGAVLAAARVLTQIADPDRDFTAGLFGLHLDTWALIVSAAAVLAAGLVLFLTPAVGPREFVIRPADTRTAALCTLGVLALFALANLIACFFLQGLHWQPTADPDSYTFFSDLN